MLFLRPLMEHVSLSRPFLLKSKLADYAQLTKMRLSALVVFSAAMGYLTAPGAVDWNGFIFLLLGGFLVTGASNGLNQIFERDLDKLMDRTASRPLPDQRMSVSEALLVCLICGVAGVLMLGVALNVASGLLGLIALISYAFVYTPMKRRSPFCVFIGALPGAIPPLLGWVAATGSFGMEGWILFTIQFFWQFPHFWSIAWVLDDDYKKAGFIMLPTGKRDKGSAFQVLIYTASLIPVVIMPVMFGISGTVSAIASVVITLMFIFAAFRFYRRPEMEQARQVMFASFLYLPLIQLVLMLDKI
jgi:heme o synthase